eukprot:scaffold2505_cov157-Skeletonema_menzelii.AAC.5
MPVSKLVGSSRRKKTEASHTPKRKIASQTIYRTVIATHLDWRHHSFTSPTERNETYSCSGAVSTVPYTPNLSYDKKENSSLQLEPYPSHHHLMH